MVAAMRLILPLGFALLFAAHAQAGVVVDHSATSKICQVTGQTDRSTGQPTINQTETRFGFWGTDLGSSFEHDGKLVVLFGDTHAVAGLNRARDRDMLALSTETNPDNCLKLDVLTDSDGGYRPLKVAGVDGGEFSVPTGGFSAGGAMHVVLTTDRTPDSPMGRSVLARSVDNGRNFQPEFELSATRFINVAAAKHDGQVLLWGSGRYRQSPAYLATLPEDQTGDRKALRYFAGLDAGNNPRWSPREEDSRPLFDQACLGELSVAWNADLAKWVMLYNCGAPQSRILVRSADKPWGPWSEPQTLFDAAADDGFCRFMHDGGGACPGLGDPHSPQVAGDSYAPYMIARFSHGEPGSHSDIYFLMSTWNPYNVVLMKARLILERPTV